MPGKQAKILSTDHIDDLLFFADHSRSPLRNRLIVLLPSLWQKMPLSPTPMTFGRAAPAQGWLEKGGSSN